MRLADALRDVTRVCLDSSAVIDYAEGQPRSIATLTRLFQRIDAGEIQAVGSVLLFTEVMVYAQTDAKLAEAGDKFRALLGALERVPVTEEIANRAAELRLRYRLQSLDALHLATAQLSGCQAFVTSDSDFLRTTGLLAENGKPLTILHTERVTP